MIEKVEIFAKKRHLGQDTIIPGKGQGRGGIGLFEEAIEGGATAGKGGIDGSLGVEGLFYAAQFGMKAEDGFFEVVVKMPGPGGDRSLDDVPEG